MTAKGVPRDDAEAVLWFRVAAEQGHDGAQFNLSVMYAYGRGVRQNEDEVARWSHAAAEQGNANAQYGLGVLYANGRGRFPR